MYERQTLDGTVDQPLRVRVFVDETKPDQHSRWQYFSVVLVEEGNARAVVDLLQEDRRAAGYERELHFQKVKRAPKVALAKRWLDRLMYRSEPRIAFHVFGVNHDRLLVDAFGETGAEARTVIYTRFFRTAVAYAVRRYYPGQVIVTDVVHDRAEVEHHDIFDWHALWRMNSDHDITFGGRRVRFVDSDHAAPGNNPVDSHLVQLADLLAGATRTCLDIPTTNPHKLSVAEHFLPLVVRLCDSRAAGNPNSRYGHLGRCGMSFFPRAELTLDQLDDPHARFMSGIYTDRTPGLLTRENGQLGLFA
jgi:hypothetical protein